MCVRSYDPPIPGWHNSCNLLLKTKTSSSPHFWRLLTLTARLHYLSSQINYWDCVSFFKWFVVWLMVILNFLLYVLWAIYRNLINILLLPLGAAEEITEIRKYRTLWQLFFLFSPSFRLWELIAYAIFNIKSQKYLKLEITFAVKLHIKLKIFYY